MALSIKLSAFDTSSLNGAINTLLKLSNDCKLKSSVTPLPSKIQKFTVLRGPHVNKKAREQFEMRTHSKLLVLKTSTSAATSEHEFLRKSVNVFSTFPVSANVKLKTPLL